MFYKLRNLLLVLFTIFMFVGCSKSTKNTPLGKATTVDHTTIVDTIPTWYLNPPSNSEEFIYGVGEGKDLKEAKIMALKEMSARLTVYVSSIINKTARTSKNNAGLNTYNKNVTQSINVKTKRIKFNNVKTLRVAMAENTYFIIVRVDRKKLFNDKKQEFLLINQTIDTLYSQSKNLPKLEKIYTLQKIKKKILEAKKKASIAYAINNNFNYKKYFEQYNIYASELIKLKSDLKVNVTTNDSNKIFISELISLLNFNNYKISSTNSSMQINLYNKAKYSVTRGWQIAKVSTTISVVSKGKTVANQTIHTIGRSSSTKINALTNASKNFKKKITKIGLDKILFNK